MKEYESLISYLTNIILRPHRETYGVQKLGPSKIVVKSHEKSISMLESMSKNEKHLPKELQQNYCELIEVNRREVTIKRQGKNIQVSIYEPQLTSLQSVNNEDERNTGQVGNRNYKFNNFPQKKSLYEKKYENCVIFLHANSGSRLQGTEYAKHVLQYRTLCVSFDYTGSGISEGQYTTMGINQSKDLSSVMNYIAETYKVKKFSLWGRSMGAVTGIYYLLTKYKQDVTKIRVTSCVIDSPFSHLQQLIKEIASRKSSLPQFVFQPILKVIQNDIISKVGVNIFTQLNLIQKIKSLTNQETKLINSVSFLGLASKEDTMINHQHCQELCSLLIPEDVRRSDLIDRKNYLVNNSYDKHLMMLVEFKKQINTKGDFIEIEGDHNKPRSNQVKQKVSFFIQDNFFSFKDFQLPVINPVSQEKQNPIAFSKTGVSIKTKLSFAKNGLTKPRKDSTANSQLNIQQSIKQESFPRHNYNLINLKDIKAKQSKQSLSKQKQSIRNSLNKNFLFRQRKDIKQGVQTAKSIENGKGLNIVSKEYHRERINPTQQSSKMSKKAYENLQNSKNFSKQLQPQRKKIFQQNTHFTSFLAKLKGENPSKNENYYIKKNEINNSPNISDQSGSVNNSLKKQRQGQIEEQRQKIVVSPLEFTENPLMMNLGQNLTQRPIRTERIFEGLPSQRVIRNNRTQPDISDNALNQSPIIATSPFNLSIQNRSNLSLNARQSADDPFRKKDTSQIMQETDLSNRKQGAKTPQVKISISQFRNRQQEGVNVKSVNKRIQKVALRKQNNSTEENTTAMWSQSNTINMLESTQSVYSQDQLSSKNSIQFKKRQPAETNSIHNSDVSYQESFEYNRSQHGQNRSFLQVRRQDSNNKNGFNMNYQANNNNKHPSVSNSFTQQPNSVSLKQMMINNGHKGMTQSSTFNYNQQNAFYQPVFINQQQQDPKYYGNLSYQYVNQNGNYHTQQNYANYMNMQAGNQFYSDQGKRDMFMATTKSMKTSQDPAGQDFNRLKQYPNNKVTMSAIQSNNAFQQCNNQNQQNAYIMNSSNPSFWYVPHQGVKQSIQYKKKINKLLD